MESKVLTLNKLEGYSGIRLKNGKPLVFKPGINLLVGRNGCGKTNLLRLIQQIATDKGDLKDRIESSFFIKHCRASLKRTGPSIENRFGAITIAQHTLNGEKGRLRMLLKNVPEEYVLKNIMRNGSGFQSNVEIRCNTVPVVYRQIHGSLNPPKFEMTGYMSSNLFSREHDNKVHSIMEGPMKSVSDFIKMRLTEFYESEEFITRIDELEDIINKKFTRFLGTTNKAVKINYSDIGSSGRISLSLMDSGNYIQSIDISTGEAILLNLVFSMTLAKDEGCDILSLDEPDIHMHDDMIQVLVNELAEFSNILPNCIIVVASHSTALIEKLASLGQNVVNIITFDNERNVGNTQNDVELINALHRNGVMFSPLMLSRRQNIFIENQFKGGNSHRDFLLKFFSAENLPNIIPIGSAGNVQDSDSFTSVFEEVLRAADVTSVGVQDGDIWFKPQLVDYLRGKLKLGEIITALENQQGAYIRSKKMKPNAYFFNSWEIENLYLMDELLSCWQLTNSSHLTKAQYIDLLNKNRKIIAVEYFDTFFKTITKIRTEKKHSIEKRRESLIKSFSLIDGALDDVKSLEDRMKLLIDSILDCNLLHWVPGKEVKRFLESRGYLFKDTNFLYERCELTKQVRAILDLQ